MSLGGSGFGRSRWCRESRLDHIERVSPPGSRLRTERLWGDHGWSLYDQGRLRGAECEVARSIRACNELHRPLRWLPGERPVPRRVSRTHPRSARMCAGDVYRSPSRIVPCRPVHARIGILVRPACSVGWYTVPSAAAAVLSPRCLAACREVCADNRPQSTHSRYPPTAVDRGCDGSAPSSGYGSGDSGSVVVETPWST